MRRMFEAFSGRAWSAATPVPRSIPDARRQTRSGGRLTPHGGAGGVPGAVRGFIEFMRRWTRGLRGLGDIQLERLYLRRR